MINEVKIPYDAEAEKAVIGSLLIDGECIYDVISIVTPDDFFTEQNRWIFEACLKLHQKHSGINQITVARELSDKLEDSGGTPYLSHLIVNTPTSLHAQYYAEIVKNLADKRRLISIGQKVTASGYSEDKASDSVSNVISMLLDFQNKNTKSGLMLISSLADDYSIKIAEWMGSDKEIQGYSTGFKKLDRKIDGLLPKKLYIVAARPGMGKTQTVLNIAVKNAEAGRKVAIYSLEMDAESLYLRMVCSKANINRYALKNATKEIKEKFWDTWAEIKKLPIKINDTSQIKTDTTMSEVMVQRATDGIDLVIFDHLTLAGDTNKESDVKRVGQITRNLRNIGKIADIPVLSCCQLNRALESRPNKRPLLSDLRDSGEIEQDADVVIGEYRDEKYNDGSDPKKPVQKNTLEMIILKNRDGEVGTIEQFYNASTGFMGELAQ